MNQPILFEISQPGLFNDYLPPLDVATSPLPFEPRAELPLPEIDEHSLVRHFTRLSQLNFSIDTHFYPLGSCTMKYNPKLNEAVAAMPGFAGVHPLQDAATCQGWLEVLFEAQTVLAKIAGLHDATVQPLAGAQGEFAGLLMIRAYHDSRGETDQRRRIVVPDSAHGTNPASAARCGYDVTSVHSDEAGCVDIEAMRAAIGPRRGCGDDHQSEHAGRFRDADRRIVRNRARKRRARLHGRRQHERRRRPVSARRYRR